MASQQYDVWAVTSPTSDADFFVVEVKPTEATALTLAGTIPGVNGTGYKVTITSNGDDDNVAFTVTGVASNGVSLAEVVTGPNATSVTSTNYFATVFGVSCNSATDGNVTVGYSSAGGFSLPMTRIKGLYYVGNTDAGAVVATRTSDSRVLLDLKTPAGSGAFSDSLYIAAEGIKTGKSYDDSAVVTTVNLTSLTLFCG